MLELVENVDVVVVWVPDSVEVVDSELDVDDSVEVLEQLEVWVDSLDIVVWVLVQLLDVDVGSIYSVTEELLELLEQLEVWVVLSVDSVLTVDSVDVQDVVYVDVDVLHVVVLLETVD